MIDLIQLLSEGSKPPVQGHLEPEDQSQPQRHQEKLRLQPDGRPVVVKRPREKRFEPSAEMLDAHKDIEQARLRVARAYNRLTITGNGTPNFRSLKKFKEFVRKATLLENKYKDMEAVERQARQDKREAEIRNISEHKECAIQPLKVSLKSISDSVERAKDALAEGLMKIDEFRGFIKNLDSDSLKASTEALVARTISP